MIYQSLKATCLTFVAFVLFGLPVRAEQQVIQFGYDVGYASKSLRKDIKIAVEYILGEAFGKNGIKLKFSFFETKEENLDALLSGKLEVAAISGMSYASLPESQRSTLTPFLIVQRGENPLSNFLLLTSPEHKKISDLKDGKLRCMTHWHREVDLACLDQFLSENHYPNASSFFSEVKICEEPGDAVLPTFFGESDACLISETDFQLLIELNPQIKTRLKPLATFSSMAPVMIVKRSNYQNPKLKDATETAVKIHETPSGQQAFTILKMKKFSLFEQDYVTAVLDLARRMANHDKTKSAAIDPIETN